VCLRVQLLLVALCLSFFLFLTPPPQTPTIAAPLIAPPPLPCVFGKSKKRKERNTTARVIPDRADPPLSLFVSGSRLHIHWLCISFGKFKTKKIGVPNPDRPQLRKFWSPRKSYHTKGRQDFERERERESVCGNFPKKVRVVTCSFEFLCSYNQFVSFSGRKKIETKKQKKKVKQKGDYLIWAHHAGCPGVRTCCYLFFSLVFPLPPYPCSTFALCFQQL
jgi:hypothetical protein